MLSNTSCIKTSTSTAGSIAHHQILAFVITWLTVAAAPYSLFSITREHHPTLSLTWKSIILASPKCASLLQHLKVKTQEVESSWLGPSVDSRLK